MKTHILLATLALSLSAYGQTSPPPTITLEIPIEAAGHSFELWEDYYMPTPVFSGLPVYDASSGKFLVSGIPPYGWSYWSNPLLVNLTLGQTQWASASYVTDPLLLPLPPADAGTLTYAMAEGLENHSFALVAPGVGAFPVTKLPVLGSTVNDSDGNPVFLSMGFFNAFVKTEIGSLSPANTVLVDLTAQLQSVGTATDLRDPAAWAARTVALPTRAAVFSFGTVDYSYNVPAGTVYTLHTSSGSLQGLVPFYESLYNEWGGWIGYDLRVSGQVGITEEYWLTRDGTADTTPHFFMGVGSAGVVQSAAPLAVPTANFQTVTFSIGENHFNEYLVVSQNGTFTTLDRDWSSAGQNMLVTWDANGTAVQYYFDYFTATFDVNAPWQVGRANGSEFQSLGQTTDLRDGFTPFNPAPPTGSVSVSIPEARRASLVAGQIRLLTTDGLQWAVSAVPGFEVPGYNYSCWSGVFIGTPLEHWSYFYYIPATAPSSTSDWLNIALHDISAGDTTEYGAGGSELNFTMALPLTTLNFNLPSSRWDQELYLMTAAGGMFPVNKGTIQGLWSLNGSGANFSSYGYFDASAQAHTGADWWVYAPYGDNGSPAFSDPNGLDGNGNPSLMNWNTTWADSDSDTLPDWYEYIIGTNSNAWDSDGDGIGDYDEIVTGTNPNQAAPILTVTSPVGAVWVN